MTLRNDYATGEDLPADDVNDIVNAIAAIVQSKTANYTALAGDLVSCDNSGGPFTVSLPAAPASGDAVAVSIGVSAAVNTHSIFFVSSLTQYAGITDAAQTGLDFTGNFTVEAWVNLKSYPSSGNMYGMVSKYTQSGDQRSFTINYKNNSGVLQFQVGFSSDGISANEKTLNYFLPLYKWVHLAFVYTAAAGTLDVYVNGVNVGQMTSLPTSIFNSTAEFHVGDAGSLGGSYDGSMDDVRAWNTARTAAQIYQNFERQLVGNESGLQGYWKFNNSYADATANANTLTASSSPTFMPDAPFRYECVVIDGNGKTIAGNAKMVISGAGALIGMVYNGTLWVLRSLVSRVG